MKKNYSSKLMLAAAVVIMLNFNSCGKYEDGPTFSLRAKTSRLVGEWEVERVGGQVLGSDFQLYMEFEKDGDFSFTYLYDGDSYTYKGEWEWEDSKEAVEVTIDNEVIVWDILRLTEKELWFEDEDKDEWKCEKK